VNIGLFCLASNKEKVPCEVIDCSRAMADIFELEGVQEKVKQLELFNETEVEIVDLGKRSKLCRT
jgi:hypothetical protein